LNSYGSKDVFRELFISSEDAFKSHNTISSLSQIAKAQFDKLNVEFLINKTYQNLNLIKANILLPPQISIIGSNNKNGFGLVVLCENSHIKNLFKNYLIENNIYPAVLWPNQYNNRDILISESLLFIHVDFRYSNDDILYMVEIIKGFSQYV
jgi:hypothetical protein